MQPRQMRETFTPVEPRLTYSIAQQARTKMRAVKAQNWGPPAHAVGTGALGRPSRPSNTPVPPERRFSGCRVSSSFVAWLKSKHRGVEPADRRACDGSFAPQNGRLIKRFEHPTPPVRIAAR